MTKVEIFETVFILIAAFVVLALILWLLSRLSDKQLKEEEEAETRRLEEELAHQREMAALRAKAEHDRELQHQKRFGSYGKKTVDILVGGDEEDFKSHFLVFEEPGILVVNNEDIRFADIIGFNLQDNSVTIATTSKPVCVTETSRSTGEMLGRAAVGGLFFGKEGALAGALTADQETVSHEIQPGMTETRVIHDYVVYINVNDLTNHTRRLHIGNDEEKANNIINVLNVIVVRNMKKN